jgi:hypothetical protein
MVGPILPLDGSIDAYFAKDVPFGSGENKKKIKRSDFRLKIEKLSHHCSGMKS